jgi:hypothetical protein
MGLEQFCRSRLVVLSATASAYEAARAMEENHIGMVLVSGEATPLLGVVGSRLVLVPERNESARSLLVLFGHVDLP